MTVRREGTWLTTPIQPTPLKPERLLHSPGPARPGSVSSSKRGRVHGKKEEFTKGERGDISSEAGAAQKAGSSRRGRIEKERTRKPGKEYGGSLS